MSSVRFVCLLVFFNFCFAKGKILLASQRWTADVGVLVRKPRQSGHGEVFRVLLHWSCRFNIQYTSVRASGSIEKAGRRVEKASLTESVESDGHCHQSDSLSPREVAALGEAAALFLQSQIGGKDDAVRDVLAVVPLRLRRPVCSRGKQSC